MQRVVYNKTGQHSQPEFMNVGLYYITREEDNNVLLFVSGNK